ncbi:hypothetical protein ABZY45_29285 [Streptomyces sp. NPDC006516]|uniref:hypothetical protein n=1 Tax=Streptomyces sp. NPDC006516 TaxID=3154309 RepID=UPI0033BA0A8C
MLDGAASSLDLATERRVSAATDLLSRRRTTVVVAHRLSTDNLTDHPTTDALVKENAR